MADDPTPDPVPTPDPAPDKPDPDDEPLGDAGTKALEAMKERARKAEREAKAAIARAEAAEAKHKTEAEKAIDAARKEGAESVQAKVNEKLKASAAVAAAAGKLANPKLAAKLIDLSDITVDDDGEVDEAALSKAIDDLLKTDPYLAADAKPRPGSGGGGARQDAPTGDSMNDLIRRAAGR